MRKITPPRKKKFFHTKKKIDERDINKVHQKQIRIKHSKHKQKTKDILE